MTIATTAWHAFKEELDELQLSRYGAGAGRVVITSVVDDVDGWSGLDESSQLELLGRISSTECRSRYRCVMLPDNARWLEIFEEQKQAIASAYANESQRTRFASDDAVKAIRMIATITRMLDKALEDCVGAGADLEAVLSAECDTAAAVAALHKTFVYALAVTLAATQEDHWHVHTESPEELVQVSARVDALWTHLLSFNDSELGILDPYSRYGIVAHLDRTAEKWGNDVRELSFELSQYNSPMRIERINNVESDRWRQAGQHVFNAVLGWGIVIGVAFAMTTVLL